MSKMRVPKMEVVRFKESDVIVASGALASLTLLGFANTRKNDGTMTYKGMIYDGDNYSDLISVLTGDGYSDYIGENYQSVSGLFIMDSKGKSNGITSDGTYIWNSGEETFLKQ